MQHYYSIGIHIPFGTNVSCLGYAFDLDIQIKNDPADAPDNTGQMSGEQK